MRNGPLSRAIGVSLLAFAAPGAAQLAPPVAIPTYTPPAVSKAQSAGAIHISSRPAPVPIVLAVSPSGSDDGDGSAARPFATLARAQDTVRRLNGDHDVTVQLADGVYRLKAPLRFTAADGGQRGFTVRWEAAPGAHPVVSGGTPVTGWTLADRKRGIWVADIPHGVDPRQLWVGGHMAPRAAVRAPRTAFRFDKSGIEIVDPAWRSLARLPDQTRVEVEATGWFTDRHAMVARIDGDRIVMQQPGWRNNLVGYDTFARSVWGDNAALFFVNALAFLREPGQWYADPAAGKLYYKPAAGEDMARLDVVLPRLERLLSIAGSYDATIKDLQFRGLSFRHTSWLLPSGPEGYASQQSGSFLRAIRKIRCAIAHGAVAASKRCATAGGSSLPRSRSLRRRGSCSITTNSPSSARSRSASATIPTPMPAGSAWVRARSRCAVRASPILPAGQSWLGAYSPMHTIRRSPQWGWATL
ncbi:hypothetical protein [Sphingomonas sp. UYP23]